MTRMDATFIILWLGYLSDLFYRRVSVLKAITDSMFGKGLFGYRENQSPEVSTSGSNACKYWFHYYASKYGSRDRLNKHLHIFSPITNYHLFILYQYQEVGQKPLYSATPKQWPSHRPSTSSTYTIKSAPIMCLCQKNWYVYCPLVSKQFCITPEKIFLVRIYLTKN